MQRKISLNESVVEQMPTNIKIVDGQHDQPDDDITSQVDRNKRTYFIQVPESVERFLNTCFVEYTGTNLDQGISLVYKHLNPLNTNEIARNNLQAANLKHK